MKYNGLTKAAHKQSKKVAVLITNLGTPNAPTAKALRPYLKQFLSDPRVVEIPKLVWWFILNLIIVPFRSPKSSKLYEQIWTEDGSPLLTISLAQQAALKNKLKQSYGDDVIVELAMRYGNPSISEKLSLLQESGAREIIVLPLYPQYSSATAGSTFDAIAEDFKTRRWVPSIQFINSFCDFDPYIEAMVDRIEKSWSTKEQPEKLMFSFHGMPERTLHLGDPYFCECQKTTRLLATRLQERTGFNAENVIATFQSRFGKATWLQPYTEQTVKKLAADGVKNLHVFCPGFSADCLETLEEIVEENRSYFIEAGGESFTYIPALNDSESFIDAIKRLLAPNIEHALSKLK